MLFLDNSAMAKALARAFFDAGVVNKEDITVEDPSSERWKPCLDRFATDWGDEVESLLHAADVIAITSKSSYCETLMGDFRSLSLFEWKDMTYFSIAEDIKEIFNITPDGCHRMVPREFMFVMVNPHV